MAVSACGGRGGGGGGGSTAIKTWSAPERINFVNNATHVGSPEIAADANGNAVAIYSDGDATSGAGGAVVNRYAPGVGWGQPTVISTPPTATSNPAFSTDIAIAPSGEAVGVFIQDSNALSKHLTPPSAWNIPQSVDASIRAARDVQIAMDSNGRGTAVWVEDTFPPTGDDLYVSNYTPGGNWVTPLRIDNVPANQTPAGANITTGITVSPAIAADAAGRVYVAGRKV